MYGEQRHTIKEIKSVTAITYKNVGKVLYGAGTLLAVFSALEGEYVLWSRTACKRGQGRYAGSVVGVGVERGGMKGRGVQAGTGGIGN